MRNEKEEKNKKDPEDQKKEKGTEREGGYELQDHSVGCVRESQSAYGRRLDQSDEEEEMGLFLLQGGKGKEKPVKEWSRVETVNGETGGGEKSNWMQERPTEEEWPAGDKTLKDYIDLPEERRVELIDGTFYDMASPTFGHSILVSKILFALNSFIEKNKGLCIASVAPTDIQLDYDDKTVVVPDVFVICDRKKITLPRIVGAPDLIVEVVSPGNWRTDAIKKREKYEKAGVREYWLVFPKEKRVVVYQFENDEVKEYSFADKIPVGIWDGKCEVDFVKINEEIKFLYE